MRNYNTSPINSAAGAPIKSGTIDHLQLAYKEVFNEIIKTMIGSDYDSTKTYRLYGAQVYDPFGSDFYITFQGAIFYDGELYIVDEVGGAGVNMPDYIGLTISTTQYTTNADPVTYSDTSVHNVHDIKKMVYFNSITSGADSLPLPEGYLYALQYPATFGSDYAPNTLNHYEFFDDVRPLDGANIYFRHNTLWQFGASSVTSNSVILNPANGKQGCNVKLWAYGTPGVPVNFLGTSSANVIATGATAIGPGGWLVSDITYTGSGLNTFIVQST